MLVNGYLEEKNIYSTVCDDYASMYDATLQLIHSGHSLYPLSLHQRFLQRC